MKLDLFGFGCAALIVLSGVPVRAAEKSWSVRGWEALEIDTTCARTVDIQPGGGKTLIRVAASADHQEEIDNLRIGGKDDSRAIIAARHGKCWGGEPTLTLRIEVPPGMPVTGTK